MKRPGTLTVRVDPAAVSMAAAISAAAEAAPLMVVTSRALADLADELGGFEQAARELLAVAESINKPICVNLVTGADSSSTAFVAPRSWTEERLKGWAAGHRELLERQFGPIASVRRMP